MPSVNRSYAELVELAEAQQGFFTTKQAIKAGYSDNTHPYHVRAGHWLRHCRGVYRLAHFPFPEDGEMMGWYLWAHNRSQEPQGVYSHQTALSVYDLSDIMPAKLHLTVPPGFRRSSPIPRVLKLHRAKLAAPDIVKLRGFAVTRALRTILDLFAAQSVSLDIIRQAFEEGTRRGLITLAELEQAKTLPGLHPDLADLLRTP
jgi:predicted transcriptional regulator of viral defense system